MTETFRCGDSAGLVGYLYDDCLPGEREAIAAHLLTCRTCADELEALSSARYHLASWIPPETRLGFRVTQANDDSRVLPFVASGSERPPNRRWWREPLPAWAQVAAAVAIFAAGLAIGASPAGVQPETVSDLPASSRAELVALEQRIGGLEGQVDVARLLEQVRQEIKASEKRQVEELRVEFASRVGPLAFSQQAQLNQIRDRLDRSDNSVMLTSFEPLGR